MNDPNERYKWQHQKAQETLQDLEEQKNQIDFQLRSNPICSNLHKELRKINLDIKITKNELEHVESNIQDLEMK
jgi:prefoldin subunit 5